jgi:phospholipase/carboxylesterase
MSLNTYKLAPLSKKAPHSIVLFLHGLGDSGSGGLLEICRFWQQSLPDTEFLCPDAPFAFDMAPPDFGGRQWFSLREFTKQSIAEGIKSAAPLLDQYIDEILETYHLSADKLALVGFSQGTMMALHVALRRKKSVAAVIGYSGMLADPEYLNAEIKSSPPVLLIHGSNDEVVPFAAMAAAESVLKSAGVNVQSIACPRLAHSIDELGVAKGMEFLHAHLK